MYISFFSAVAVHKTNYLIYFFAESKHQHLTLKWPCVTFWLGGKLNNDLLQCVYIQDTLSFSWFFFYCETQFLFFLSFFTYFTYVVYVCFAFLLICFCCREEENLVFCFGAEFNSTLNFTQSGWLILFSPDLHFRLAKRISGQNLSLQCETATRTDVPLVVPA